jgi:hypothetical protein
MFTRRWNELGRNMGAFADFENDGVIDILIINPKEPLRCFAMTSAARRIIGSSQNWKAQSPIGVASEP